MMFALLGKIRFFRKFSPACLQRNLALGMRKLHTKRFSDRRGIAAVEAAVCLPVLIIIWLGTVEITRTLTLKQQAQLLSSTAAHRVIDSTTALSEIESNLTSLAEELDIQGVDVSVTRFDTELVEASVSINIDQNSSLGTLFPGRSVNSTYYSYREE